MFTKTDIFNIALTALRLNYQTTDADNDENKNVKALRSIYLPALSKVLDDLDLNRTASKVKLEERSITGKHPHWEFVYRYPANCARFRKIVSPVPVDNRNTLIPSATETVGNALSILTNFQDAYAEIIRTDIPLSSLNASAAFALGYQMAMLCPGLIVGKGSTALRQDLQQNYIIFKAEAKESDLNENVDTTPDAFQSEFVQAMAGSVS